MINKLLNWDTELLVILNNLGSLRWDDMWVFITNKYSSIPVYLVLIIALILTFKKRAWIYLLSVTALGITATDQTANLFKNGFKRLRPCHEEGVVELLRDIENYGCPSRYGYFSAHAANSMMISVFFIMTLRLKSWKLSLMLSWCGLVSYSRIYLGVHYPLDTLTGLIIGGCYGLLFYKLAEKVSLKIYA